jgi:Mg2+ and Co2+ transporter CorA
MNVLRRIPTYAVAFGAALAILPACASEISPAIRKNADILQTILHTAFKDSDASRLSSLQYSYLSGQGLLFQANAMLGNRHMFHFSGHTLGMAPVAPVPLPGGEFEFEFDTGEIERLAEAAQDMAEQIQQQQRRHYRVAEQKRDIERELRDAERDKRDIEFSKKLSKLDEEQQKELELLQQKTKVLQEKLADVEKEAAKSQKELQQQRSELQAEHEQKTAAMVKTVGEKFTQILCDYGASLRDIPDNEYVTLQVSARRADGSYYWVVKKADINQCMSGKIKAKDLLAKAKIYQF